MQVLKPVNERIGKHQVNCRLKRKDSAHYRHNLEKHHGEQEEIKVMVLGKCPNDPMLRQCKESVVVRDNNPEMNLRVE